MTPRSKATDPVPIGLLAPRYIPMNAEEEARAVAALVAVLVHADEMDARRPGGAPVENDATGGRTTGDATAA
ncbi:MAG: hypothetical protein ACRDV9_11460 [Acidimicrobiia bacterium]